MSRNIAVFITVHNSENEGKKFNCLETLFAETGFA